MAVQACYNRRMNPWIMRAAVAVWVLCLIGVLVFRGNQAANIILLLVSFSLIGIGVLAMRRK